jgi:hypothetical protein
METRPLALTEHAVCHNTSLKTFKSWLKEIGRFILHEQKKEYSILARLITCFYLSLFESHNVDLQQEVNNENRSVSNDEILLRTSVTNSVESYEQSKPNFVMFIRQLSPHKQKFKPSRWHTSGNFIQSRVKVFKRWRVSTHSATGLCNCSAPKTGKQQAEI